MDNPSLAALGWSAFFADQTSSDDTLVPARIATVHRTHMSALTVTGTVQLSPPLKLKTTDYTVGDWVLIEADKHLVIRRLERRSLLQRQTENTKFPQLIAANINTLLIVTSCNKDFNPARLERYLALCNEAKTTPVIVLTKADQTDDPAHFRQQAANLQRNLSVVSLNAKSPDASAVLTPWCGPGETVALIGSSGVGKSTLLNTLTGLNGKTAQATGVIREADDKGRHTTTARSLHRITSGGWCIDTPGIRTLHISDMTVGLDVLFAEIVKLTPDCRFRDCTHAHEPGCAVLAAVKAGTLDPARLERWRKLSNENRNNTPILTGPRGNKINPSHRDRR